MFDTLMSRPLMSLPSLARLKLKLDFVTAHHLGQSSDSLWESTNLTRLAIIGPPDQMLIPSVREQHCLEKPEYHCNYIL